MLRGRKIKIVTMVSLFATTLALLSIGYAAWTISDPSASDNNASENGDVGADKIFNVTKGITVSFNSIFTFGTYNYVDANGDTQSNGLLVYQMDIDYSNVSSDIKTASGLVLNVKISFGDGSKKLFASSIYQGLSFEAVSEHTFQCTSVDITPTNVDTYRQYQLDITSSSDSGMLIFAFNHSLAMYRDVILNGAFHLTFEGVVQEQ